MSPGAHGRPESSVAIETSTRRGAVALALGERVLEAKLTEGRSHAADLLPELARLAQEAGLERAGNVLHLDFIVVGTGPGSYTGLRVGIATALGLARATHAQVLCIPSVEALAFAELAPGEEGSIVLDARAGRLYFAHYRREDREVRVLVPPSALRPAEVRERLGPRGSILADRAVLEELGVSASVLERLRSPVPSARALLELGLSRIVRGCPPASELEPLYLMPAPGAREIPLGRRSSR